MKKLASLFIFTLICFFPKAALAEQITCGSDNMGVQTALGCISFSADPGNGLVASILKLSIGLGGGIALALILYGIFIVTTSAGIPDKLKAGSEIITSAIVGLLFIILSVFLINLIGINILGLPGLN